MSADRLLYLDASAIVKLIVREEETTALQQHLAGGAVLISSALARTEVLRAVLVGGAEAHRLAEMTLARLELLRIDDQILQDAGELLPSGLRSLDAIHLASALAFGDDLTELVCYDMRLNEAAEAAGLVTVSPH